ncbi:RNA/RNP complex-1-interacting phosphatase-like [Amblyraja radiata]|uniref:RNA/RNP complex-1-interacting phosphatase-like n=1 Tax=Amblyraja radiata TaxID=386614 RepID=UPI001402BB68|nr:RNA/RNP complex-1-interacting phosphatase-like [Amblyraja radiata]
MLRGGLVALVVRRAMSARPGSGGAPADGGGGGRRGRVPDRWQEYAALGQRLRGTRFIAFKVPLKKVFASCLLPGEVFTPMDLLNQIQEQSEELGKIIDLTFTKRYYDPEELPDGLHYEKIFTAGHEVPNAKNIFSFKRAVKTFLLENMDNDKLIGVHCTHGINRTGYLICRYLIDVDGMDPRHAIDLFNRSRGYSIERQNYIQDLLQGPHRSNKGIEVLGSCVAPEQMGRFRQQPVFPPRERTNRGKYPPRNNFREFSHFACPPVQPADSYLSRQRSREQGFGPPAVHHPPLGNGHRAYSDSTGGWWDSPRTSCQSQSSWRSRQLPSDWGKNWPVNPWDGYQLSHGTRDTSERKSVSRGQVRLNTHRRWDN